MLTALLVFVLLQSSAVESTVAASLPEPDFVNNEISSSSDALPTIYVRSERHIVSNDVNSSLSALTDDEIHVEAPKHPNEIFDRVPGAWISAGSGQEHLTAIRSPVLTGAGACGAFMVLEDDVPTRPSGFCNVNQLFEVNIAQAESIEVLRGPATVTYGSNAMHGAVGVFTPGPAPDTFSEVSLEAGTDDYYRGSFSASGTHNAVQANFTDAGSFRDDEGYRHGLFNWQVNHSTERYAGRTAFSYAYLDQDTAGYIPGENAYKSEILRTKNFNPEAFRKAWAGRLSSRWNGFTDKGNDLELIPFARSSRMDFLQHFLPGKPLENNGQESAGLLFTWSDAGAWSAGIDFEWANGFLTQYQANPLESGSDFLNETRPQGFHYDYDVKALTLAAWGKWQREIRSGLELTAGLRAETLKYDYKNRMLDGNTRDDGSPCGFGGCLYSRPADRSDRFSNVSPELGLAYDLNQAQVLYLRAARGYRAPQATELYRLQSGQTVADLDSEQLDSLEIGLRGFTEQLNYELSAYMMRKDNFIFRDANGFNISDGKTRHLGVEALLYWQASDTWSFSANLSWARHEYDFNRDLGRGEVILKGNEVDTAPPWLGGVRIQWQASVNRSVEAEWVYQGGYFLDAANAHSYPGHSLLNLRAWTAVADGRHVLSLRLTNLLDVRYAERADYAFGNYRYFPGAGRRLNFEWRYRYF